MNESRDVEGMDKQGRFWSSLGHQDRDMLRGGHLHAFTITGHTEPTLAKAPQVSIPFGGNLALGNHVDDYLRL